MNTIRKNISRNILVALAVAGMGGAALAADAPQGRHGHAAGQEQMHARWAERAAAQQAKLHALLKLTPSQEAAWASYTAATRPGERGQRPDRAAMAAMPAPARMEQHIAMAKQRVAMMESRLAALKAFYAVLTPEQKKLFDENSMHAGGHGMQHGAPGAAPATPAP